MTEQRHGRFFAQGLELDQAANVREQTQKFAERPFKDVGE
jgi:hypothetical protein